MAATEPIRGQEQKMTVRVGKRQRDRTENHCTHTDFYPTGNGDQVWVLSREVKQAVHGHKMSECGFELGSS